MWLMSEVGDELEIKAVPVLRWLIAAGFLIAGLYYSPGLITYLLRNANFGDSPGVFLFTVTALLFFPAAFIAALHFGPLIITTFNKRNHTVFSKRIAISGIHTYRFDYAHLDGGIKVESEEDEDGWTWFTPYFNLKNGERIELSAVASGWHGNTNDVGMKANEYLNVPGVLEVTEVFDSADDIVTLDLN